MGIAIAVIVIVLVVLILKGASASDGLILGVLGVIVKFLPPLIGGVTVGVVGSMALTPIGGIPLGILVFFWIISKFRS